MQHQHNVGQDQEGNIYVANERGGECFDKDCQLIAQIPNLKLVNKENNTLVAGEVDGYVYPIYSTEELIETAKQLLGK